MIHVPCHWYTPGAFWVPRACHDGGVGRAEAPKGNPGHGAQPEAGDPEGLHSTWR